MPLSVSVTSRGYPSINIEKLLLLLKKGVATGNGLVTVGHNKLFH